MRAPHVLPRRVQGLHYACVVDESRQRVHDSMTARRDELGMSQQDLANAAGVGLSSVGRLERGQIIAPKIEKRIEEALGWRRGSIDAIRAGREPTLLDEPEPEPEPEHDEDAELREMAHSIQQVAEELLRRLDERDEREKRGRTKGA